MKKTIYTIFALLLSALTYGQAKLAQDSTAGANSQSSPSIQWSRNLLYGKPLYFIFDAKTGKTLPIYSAQLANYIFLGKQEAAGIYQPIGNYAPATGSVNYVPYTGAISNLNLGSHSLFAQVISTSLSGTIGQISLSGGSGGSGISSYAIGGYFQGSINFAGNSITYQAGNNSTASVGVHTFYGYQSVSRMYPGIPGTDSIVVHGSDGKIKVISPASYQTQSAADARYPALAGNYANPAWITSLAYAKLTGAPTNVTAFTNDAGYQTQSAADARYPALAGAYTNPSWVASLAYSKLTGAPALGTLAAKNNGDILASSITGNAATASNATQLNGQPGTYYAPAGSAVTTNTDQTYGSIKYRTGDDYHINTKSVYGNSADPNNFTSGLIVKSSGLQAASVAATVATAIPLVLNPDGTGADVFIYDKTVAGNRVIKLADLSPYATTASLSNYVNTTTDQLSIAGVKAYVNDSFWKNGRNMIAINSADPANYTSGVLVVNRGIQSVSASGGAVTSQALALNPDGNGADVFVGDKTVASNRVVKLSDLSTAVGSPIQQLATTFVTTAATGSTTLYTVPAGKVAVVTGVAFRVYDAAGVTVGPTVNISTVTGEDIIASTSLGTLTGINRVSNLIANTTSVAALPNATIKANITTAANAGQTCEVVLIGYLKTP